MTKIQKFTVNFNNFKESVAKLSKTHRVKINRTMTDVGHFLRGEIQDRTPVKEGFLTAEIRFTVRENQQSVSTAMYVPSNAQSKDYAIFMHESFYLLGPGSLEKQRKVNVTVGRKFITRGIAGRLFRCTG
ncbi:MAG: HK97 gp10 family phage protein [Lentisphaeria bacterium]|nr:HK97 gp10 family phage protein [Lentisphaeria bacterium]